MDNSNDQIQVLQEWADWFKERKAEDVQIHDLRGISDVADGALVLTALNPRHMNFMADEAMQMAKSKNESLYLADGLDSNGWIALDFSSFFIHIFLPETRLQYKLEDLWNKLRDLQRRRLEAEKLAEKAEEEEGEEGEEGSKK